MLMAWSRPAGVLPFHRFPDSDSCLFCFLGKWLVRDPRGFDLSIVFAMRIRVVTVFGGTGFLGRRVVRHLREHEFSVRIASRHPGRDHRLFGLDDSQLQSVE